MPVAPKIQIQRHFGELSEKETDAAVEALADLIVSFLRRRPEAVQAESGAGSAKEKETRS